MDSDPAILNLEAEIKDLRNILQNKENQLQALKKTKLSSSKNIYSNNKLSTGEVVRYSRQMIMPDIKFKGQVDLKHSKTLVVGAGGLGCPASLYLAAAGVGEIHIMDYDTVELSNLHRQILHYESDIGTPKVESIRNKLQMLNGDIVVKALHVTATKQIISQVRDNKYDVILDCTDNVPTRYLLNDVSVLSEVPLVSGSALQMEGQLTVYNYQGGPCYRCLFPVPPPAGSVRSCGDGGVLGCVPGTIGVLQAMEAIKIITKHPGVLSGRLLLFDGGSTNFRTVNLRHRSPKCSICGENPTVTGLIDYEQFCGSKAHDKVVNIDILSESNNISVKDLNKMLGDDNQLIIDVRPRLEFEMCKLPNTINFPYSNMNAGKGEDFDSLVRTMEDKNRKGGGDHLNVYLLCRRGNDSQRSVECLEELFPRVFPGLGFGVQFKNVNGGLYAYAKEVDPSFPVY